MCAMFCWLAGTLCKVHVYLNLLGMGPLPLMLLLPQGSEIADYTPPLIPLEPYVFPDDPFAPLEELPLLCFAYEIEGCSLKTSGSFTSDDIIPLAGRKDDGDDEVPSVYDWIGFLNVSTNLNLMSRCQCEHAGTMCHVLHEPDAIRSGAAVAVVGCIMMCSTHDTVIVKPLIWVDELLNDIRWVIVIATPSSPEGHKTSPCSGCRSSTPCACAAYRPYQASSQIGQQAMPSVATIIDGITYRTEVQLWATSSSCGSQTCMCCTANHGI